VTKTVLDHVSIGTHALADGWELFGGVLGGTWVYGGDSPGFWWGQLEFRTGPKIELITPAPGPDSAFLERFLDGRGPGPHHLNFIVSDIAATLRRIQALGIDPVQVRLDHPNWKEAFLRPRDAFGIVIQVAEQSGPPPERPAPAGLRPARLASSFTLVEHYVDDMDAAIRLFGSVLDGEVVRRPGAGGGSVAELTWPNGTRLRLIAGGEPALGNTGGAAGPLHFSRDDEPFSEAELSRAAGISRLLGVRIELGS
jgi:methylmalonyl-CoA/ethylmalonyl-CoA epimerase